jgi:hypothetical protein
MVSGIDDRLRRQWTRPANYEGEKMLDKDRDCMKALLIPEARMIFVSLGTGGASTYRIETLDAGPAMSGEFL